jgi:hypothetical protein
MGVAHYGFSFSDLSNGCCGPAHAGYYCLWAAADIYKRAAAAATTILKRMDERCTAQGFVLLANFGCFRNRSVVIMYVTLVSNKDLCSCTLSMIIIGRR